VSVAEAAAAQDAPGKIIAFPGQAVESAPAFGSTAWYAQFRAEFVRLKGMSVYERMREKDAQTRIRRQQEAEQLLKVWTWVAVHLGIYRIMGVWAAEFWRDPDTNEPRLDTGILRKTQASAVEPLAIDHLRQQAEAWESAQGRDYLTPFEARCLALEREYMQGCQTADFRRRWGDRFAARQYRMVWKVDQREEEFEENEVDPTGCYAWIVHRLASDPKARVFVAPHEVKAAIVSGGRVYTLLEALGRELKPEVREMVQENRYRLAS
jgi:hypothetical protein